MGIWEKQIIQVNGQETEATAPIIISASRATDIPAFYGKWLIDKFQKGYLVKINPFNGKREFISLKKVRVIVFWTKNAKPFMKWLKFFDDLGIHYYFLYTVNNYPEYELHLPKLETRIENFIELSQLLGKQRVLWRFDPLILSQEISEHLLLERIHTVGEKIHKFTTRLIFSFVELSYKKVQANLKKYGKKFFTPSCEQKLRISKEIVKLCKTWDIQARTCASADDFSHIGAQPNKCIDDELMVRLWHNDTSLMKFLGYSPLIPYISSHKLKDKGQRKNCKCIYSKDIGRYNTCPHGCIYCYANASFEKALENYNKHNFKSLSI